MCLQCYLRRGLGVFGGQQSMLGGGKEGGSLGLNPYPHFPVIHLAVLTSEVLRCSFVVY